MCGIVGILVENASVPPELLERATLSLAHRGPDDHGTAILRADGPRLIEVGLGARRLAILDLSPRGHQPMQDPATGNRIAFNGEIYNFRELRQELEGSGCVFRSHSDTEVVLAAYRVWGEACLARLRGMFAFALWDQQKSRLTLARDPMGIKPLYYWHSGGTFLFASELRTLLQTGLVRRKIDAVGALSYLAFGSVCEPWTIVDGVRAVPPGSTFVLEHGSPVIREYWSPLQGFTGDGAQGRSQRNEIGNETLSATLRDAVLSHLVSDVPVGVFLSGGIDSSALVAILRSAGVQASTFSLVFREQEFNEAEYSREVALRFQTDHHEIPVSLDDTLAVLPDALKAMDQPTIDGINTYLVSAKTRAAGVKVALTGLGADELFAGYSNFRRVPRMERMSQRLKRLPVVARRGLAGAMSLAASSGDQKRKFAVLADPSRSVHPYFLLRELFGAEDQHALLAGNGSADAAEQLRDSLDRSIAATAALDPVNQVSYLESCWYMRNTLLRDSDFMSMAHGLELRVPFLDRPLVEACFRIPGQQKLGRLPKSLLLENLGVDLPNQIVNRPKRGFTLPFERWLRGEMRPVVEDVLLKSDLNLLNAAGVQAVWNCFLDGKTSWSRPWSLFVLSRWCQQHL